MHDAWIASRLLTPRLSSRAAKLSTTWTQLLSEKVRITSLLLLLVVVVVVDCGGDAPSTRAATTFMSSSAVCFISAWGVEKYFGGGTDENTDAADDPE